VFVFWVLLWGGGGVGFCFWYFLFFVVVFVGGDDGGLDFFCGCRNELLNRVKGGVPLWGVRGGGAARKGGLRPDLHQFERAQLG